MSAPSPTTISARWIIPVEGEPVANGLVTIRDGRIVSITAASGSTAEVDLGNVAILPGFVNSHTHLELTEITPAFGRVPIDQIEWLTRVVQQRQAATPEVTEAAIARHVRKCLAAGTTMLADVTSSGASWKAIGSSPLRAIVFHEMLGLQRDRAMETSRRAFDWLESVREERKLLGKRLRAGLSPHAPYSAVGWLFDRAVASHAPLTTHLAELPEEIELLETRGGRLKEFLLNLGAWDEDWEPLGARPADYVRRGELRKSDWLVAHGTYLDPDDYWQLRPEAAPGGQRVAVCYCPRSTAYFGHGPHPYRSMLERGVVVCLGTDSLASAPSLSMLDEMRFLHARDESLSGQLLLTMGTLFGAWAMRVDNEIGSLKSGKSADLSCVALPNQEGDPHRLVLESNLPVVATMIAGRFVFRV